MGSSGVSDGKVAILVALEAERRALSRSLEQPSVSVVAERVVVRGVLSGREIILGASGIGQERARETTRDLLEQTRPCSLLVAGFGGGLQVEDPPGRVVLAARIRVPDAGAAILSTSTELLERARGALPEARVGTLLTMNEVVVTAAEKMALKSQFQADAVDMESRAAVEAAAERDVPVLALRVILDDAQCDFPFDITDFVRADGRPRLARFLRHIAVRPGTWPALYGLSRRIAIAKQSLRDAVGRVVAVV